MFHGMELELEGIFESPEEVRKSGFLMVFGFEMLQS